MKRRRWTIVLISVGCGAISYGLSACFRWTHSMMLNSLINGVLGSIPATIYGTIVVARSKRAMDVEVREIERQLAKRLGELTTRPNRLGPLN